MNKELILQHITAARWLISDPECWTQEAYAKLKKGIATLPKNRCAACFCSAGAIYAFDCVDVGQESDPITYLEDKLGCFDLVEYNDNHAHAEVIALFDKAIAKLSQKIDK